MGMMKRILETAASKDLRDLILVNIKQGYARVAADRRLRQKRWSKMRGAIT